MQTWLLYGAFLLVHNYFACYFRALIDISHKAVLVFLVIMCTVLAVAWPFCLKSCTFFLVLFFLVKNKFLNFYMISVMSS